MRANKYGAKRTVIDGIQFDSKMEAEYYRQLMLLQRAGAITDLELQPRFTLLDSFTKNGKKVQGIVYRADFKYKEDGKTVVVDVKGMRTKKFNIKKKLFDYRYPDLELKLVTKENGRWVSA